jgi:hypothetical protein
MTGLLFFAGCQKDDAASPANSIDERSTTTYVSSMNLYGLGTSNELYSYRSGPPATYMSETQIRGLREGEQMLAIDVRPATKQLYGVSNMSALYKIDPVTGVATPAAQSGTGTSGSSTPTTFNPALDGSTVAMDFNPQTDRLKVMTDKGQNLTINPTTGQVTNVGIATSSTYGINSIGYSNNFTGTAGTSLYNMDAPTGKLYRMSSTGSQTLVGTTGLTMTGDGGFDISRNGQAVGAYLASHPLGYGTAPDAQAEEAYRLYLISLKNGQITDLGKVKPMIGVAIQ